MSREAEHQGEIQVTLDTPVPYGNVSPHELLLAAALGARAGTHDPVDLALFKAAAHMEDLRHYQNLAYTPPDPVFCRSISRVRHLGSGREELIARGNLDSILYLCRAEQAGRHRADLIADLEETHGFQAVGVAKGTVSAADGHEEWSYLGFVPVKATRTPRSRREEPAAYRYVPVWDWQLRVLHWSAVFCILSLSLTGWLIGSGNFSYISPGKDTFYIGWLRLVHFTCGWLLLTTAILRIAGLFIASTKYQRWQALFPITPSDLRNLIRVMLNYLLCIFERGPHYVGHNPLQQVAYTGIYLVGCAAIFTGFSLYGMYAPDHWIFGHILWLNHLIGSQYVRIIHLATMWIFLAFIPIHIYLSIRADTVEREGAISSIFSGGRWCRKGTKFEDS
ncbi:MAG TPA: cytochrome b/b6 domain-containing protein [Geobacteraceae bacterium]|nr:cytochrome b/b6 domain-containing protein [Geobacteraceae bacterium]